MTVVVDASVVVAGLASADATGRWAESYSRASRSPRRT